jgi:NADH-quinone oxidoreductase subunit B/C/D
MIRRGKDPEVDRRYRHPFYDALAVTPGLSVGLTSVDRLLAWGSASSLWVFPMATSCCGIELMAAAAARVDLDRMGTIVRATPRQADVMVVAGTITVKMAPRVLRLWEQMPEPKWCIAMGSCAISGDFYRDLYPVVPGIDTFLPVDVYVPGCPPNPEALMDGLLRLKEKVAARRATKTRPVTPEGMMKPTIPRTDDPYREPWVSEEQARAALSLAPDADPGAATPAAPDERPFAGEPGALLGDAATVEVPAAEHRDACRRLLADGFSQLVYVVASHHADDHVEVAVALRRPGPGSKVSSWRVKLAAGEAAPSLADLVAGADWQEREQYDLIGVRFAGHPDLRRLLLPDDWSGHPLRRDYPADAACRPWR